MRYKISQNVFLRISLKENYDTRKPTLFRAGFLKAKRSVLLEVKS